MNLNWNYPTTIWVGEGRIKDLHLACNQLKIKKPLFVTDNDLAQSQMLKEIIKDLKIRNLNMYSKSYINHLFNSNEILASMILTLNNIIFYQQLMSKIRETIKNNTFNDFYNKYHNII